MDAELIVHLSGKKKRLWQDFLAKSGLDADEQTDITVLVWDGEEIIATGSRSGNLLKCIAVDENRQGEGLTGTVLTQLRQDAFQNGFKHLFLYTKPSNKYLFSSLFFYPIAQTKQVLLMENRQNGIRNFLDTLEVPCRTGKIGALVMNCNPFTLGHRYLIETAAGECDWVYVFVLSEQQPPFPAEDRLRLVKEGTKDLPNITVYPTGPYLISAATFPTYFLPNRENAAKVQCQLDIAVFEQYFIPKFGITTRYVGTEPRSPMTAQYNDALKAHLSIPVREIPRLEIDGQPVSASTVRSAMAENPEALRRLVPNTTYDYLIHYLKEDPECRNAEQPTF